MPQNESLDQSHDNVLHQGLLDGLQSNPFSLADLDFDPQAFFDEYLYSGLYLPNFS